MPVKKTPRIRYLIMTNKLKSFSRSAVIEIGLSDFHKMTLAIMKKHFPKQTQNIAEYGDCDFKKFPSDLFRRETQKDF